MQFFIVGFLICFDIALAVFAIAGELKRSATGVHERVRDLIWPSLIAGFLGGVICFAAGSAIWATFGAEVLPPDWRWFAACFGAAGTVGLVLSCAYQAFCILADGGDEPITSLKLIFWSTIIAGLYLGTLAYVSTPLWSWML